MPSRRRALPNQAAALLRAMLIAGGLTFASCAAALHAVNLTATDASGAALELGPPDRPDEPAARWIADEPWLIDDGMASGRGQPAASMLGDGQATVALLAQLLRQRYGQGGG